MDLQEQLSRLFPDHVPGPESEDHQEKLEFWMQDDPLICKYEKRKGKPITIIEGYNGAKSDYKTLTRKLKQQLSVGGSFKDEQIFIQGDYRDKVMDLLRSYGFNVKRVGG